MECVKWEQLKESVKNNFKAFTSLCDPTYLENLRDRVKECDDRWKTVTVRLQNTKEYIQVSKFKYTYFERALQFTIFWEMRNYTFVLEVRCHEV